MNDNKDKSYQDDFQVPSGVTVNNPSESQGYNDTYYDQSYNENKYNEYEEPKKKLPWKIIIIAVLALLFIFLFWYFLFGRGSDVNVNIQYEKLTDELCAKAMTYVEKKEGIIDKETPGATAYVSLQDLVDDYSIPSTPVKDPRYKKPLFSKAEGSEYISFNSYLRLFVMPNGQVSCEGLIDTGEDHTKPILSLKGTTPVKIVKGTNFEDPGAKAVDDVDGDITDKIVRSGNVDILVEGEYKITYSVTDTSGNMTTVDRIVVVENYKDVEITLGSNFDLITPQIELKGKNPYCMQVGQKYVEPGAIATDNIDGNITNRIKVDSSAVTGNRNGSFRVTYEVSDTYGHKAIAYRSVMVRSECVDNVAVGPVTTNTRPQIQLEGATSVVINIYEEYKDRGATAWDKEDGVLSVILISNTVNTNRAGIYEVVYKATDSGGLSATAKRIVTVKDPNAVSNTATFLETPENLRIPLGQSRDIPMPQAKDLYGNMLTVSQTIKDSSEAIVNSINFYRVETYRIEYFAKPANGVGQSVHRNVTIYDDVAPNLTLPDKLFVPVRTSSCDLSIVDLKAAGMVVSDSPNEVSPDVTVTGGENKVCALNTTGIDITVVAKDASGNKSEEKKAKLYIVDKVDGGDPTGVEIGSCGTNGELNMFVGDVAILTPQIYPINANDQRMTWSSALPQYATVDENGKVTAVAKGSTKIVVTTVKGGLTSTCNIIVREKIVNVAVSDVDIEGCESGTMTMVKGTTKTLKAIVKPTNASNKDVSWDFGKFDSVLFPKCLKPDLVDRTYDELKVLCHPNYDGNLVSECINLVEKCVGGTPILQATEIGEKTIKVTTADGNKTKSCLVKVVDGKLDTTPPSKVVVISNNANKEDPYNKNGLWFGGDLGRKIKIVIESTDNESKITKFEVRNSGVSYARINVYSENKCPTYWMYDGLTSKCIQDIGALQLSSQPLFTVTPEVNSPNRGILYISESMLSSVEIIAYNEAGLTSAASDPVLIQLDNDGPVTTFSSWIEDPNKWVSDNKVSVKYEASDIVYLSIVGKKFFEGNGVKEYHFTHDDVKAKEAKDIKIEGTTQAIEMSFNESNINKYVYVRAVDNLGNIGPWTQKPSYLNMDTIPPQAPVLSFLDNTNNTPNVKISFKFLDNEHPVSKKFSGFGKYEYFINNEAGVIKNTENDPLVLTTAGSYSMRAWSYDKAGNKSANYGELTGIVVTKPVTPEPPSPEPPSGGGSQIDCSGSGMSITLNGTTSAKVGDTVTLSVSAGGNVSACGFTISCGKGIGTTASYSGGNCTYKIESYPDTASEGAVGTTNVSAAILDKSGNIVKNNGANVIDYHRITVSQNAPQCTNKYRYIMTNNYTGSNSYSDWSYASASAANSACYATPKAKETVKKGVCSTTSKSVSDVKYRYYVSGGPDSGFASNYIYDTSAEAMSACKAAGPWGGGACSAQPKTTYTTKYAHILTEAFTNKTTTSAYSYTRADSALSACTAQYASYVNAYVSVVTCSADPTPKCIN